MTDSYDRIPPRTDRYAKAWEIIDQHDDPNTILSIECINKHLSETYKRTKKNTRDKYAGELHKFDRILKERGHDPLPWTINEDVVQDLLTEVWKDRVVSTKRWYTHILNRYLEFYGNHVIKELDIQWSQDTRPNVEWLNEEEYNILKKVEKTPLEDIVIALELGMGFRSVEVCRLRVRDIHKNGNKIFVEIRGKGRGEGKWRTVPGGIGFKESLERWMEERSKIVSRMKAYDPYWEEPQELVLWSRYSTKPNAGAYSEQGNSLNRGPIESLRKKVGFHFTQHTLRRTFGRRLYLASVPTEAISKILGHEDTATTLKYLGINMDDMERAMEILGNFDNSRF